MAEKWPMAMSMAVTMVAVAVALYGYDTDGEIATNGKIWYWPIISEDYSITVQTDKRVYDVGEPVKIQVMNKGVREVRLNQQTSAVGILDLSDNLIFKSSSPIEIEFLFEPGEHYDRVWDQFSYMNWGQASAGIYVVYVNGVASEPFVIR